MKVLIVGGVAGGASAATRLRRIDEKAEIILLEKGEYISYANCGLPYYIGGVIKDKERLIVTKPSLLKERFKIDVRVLNEVIKIDKDAKTVEILDHKENKTYTESYDKLILSPGASPKVPPIKGIDQQGIFTLRNIPDTFKIAEYIEEKQARSAVVVGGGFIGVELAENLAEKGLSVTIVEFLNQVLPPLDYEMANILHKHLIDYGIKLMLNTGVSGFTHNDKNITVELNNNSSIDADIVIMAIGVTPDNKLATDAGIDVGARGGIIVDDNYKTSADDIYAVGDVIEVVNFINNDKAMIPLAGPANKQGRRVADIIGSHKLHSDEKKAQSVQGSSVIKVFDLTAASTGINEKQLKTSGEQYYKTYAHPANHATYYPRATQISMKLLFDKKGKILGAQAIGYEGVDKRIDVLSTVIRLGGTVYDLENLELTYAPPYSSAKDPVNMLGYTASNILKGEYKPFYAEDVGKLELDKVELIDVSTPDEFIMCTIEGARNIPVDELRDNLDNIDKNKKVYVFCRVGQRGYIAGLILKAYGYDAYNLSGGYKTYSMVTNKLYLPSNADCVGINKGKHNREGGLNCARNDAIDNESLINCANSSTIGENKTITSVSTNAIGENKTMNTDNHKIVKRIDALGLQCPGPIMKVSESIKMINEGDIISVKATDPAFATDVKSWCDRTGNSLLDVKNEGAEYEVIIKKGNKSQDTIISTNGNDKTIVVFSGDLDKAIASFIIANGAAAMDRKVTMFFTFWGLNILRRSNKVKVKKNLIEKMFGKMMPKGSDKLGLSRMNMGGMGAFMIKGIMKKKNVSSLSELIESAIKQNITIIACQMSMDLMGIRQEELIDGVEIGGVATYLGAAENADTNLFI